MIKVEQEAVIVIGLLLLCWVSCFSCMWGIVIGCVFGIAMVFVLCIIDHSVENSIFEWGKRSGKLIYGVDVVAMQNEYGEIEWIFLREVNGTTTNTTHTNNRTTI